jgi:hypothetical protein
MDLALYASRPARRPARAWSDWLFAQIANVRSVESAKPTARGLAVPRLWRGKVSLGLVGEPRRRMLDGRPA